ncbi:MAG: hypothetical protein WC835_02740 [Candidatus Paceibacterota bacterium]|jgi:hypothetical protein
MLHPNVDKGISATFKWLGVSALIILVIGVGVSVYKKVKQDAPPPPPPPSASALMARGGIGPEIRMVLAPRDDWSDGVDATDKSNNMYPIGGGCYRVKVNGKVATNGAGKEEICNGDDVAGGQNTATRLILRFQSAEKDRDLTMKVTMHRKPPRV